MSKLSDTHYLIDEGIYILPPKIKKPKIRRIPMSEVKKGKCLLCGKKFSYTGTSGRKYCDEHGLTQRNKYVYG